MRGGSGVQVGLAAATAADAADAPLAGPLYFLNRALGTDVEIRRAGLETLLAQPLSVLILSDRPLTQGPELTAVQAFVERGGLLIRFAGPHTAATPDPLLPVRLLRQDRSLGGALSWTRPAHLAAFPAAGPFADLAAPSDVTVSRQVLADPASLQSGAVWASLVDGTPLVSTAVAGRGRIVLFHVWPTPTGRTCRFLASSRRCSTGWCSFRPVPRVRAATSVWGRLR